jgi:ABC-type multidrug transport system ATPase subunit
MLDLVLQSAGVHEAEASSRTVVLTTHNLERGLGSSQRVALLANGAIAYEMDQHNWDLVEFQHVYEQRVVSAEALP